MKHKHGTKQRKIWRKLHIVVNDDGNIITREVTTLHDSDIRTVPDLLDQTSGEKINYSYSDQRKIQV